MLPLQKSPTMLIALQTKVKASPGARLPASQLNFGPSRRMQLQPRFDHGTRRQFSRLTRASNPFFDRIRIGDMDDHEPLSGYYSEPERVPYVPVFHGWGS
jgi:hypothetical protein